VMGVTNYVRRLDGMVVRQLEPSLSVFTDRAAFLFCA
jgi:hypothetical protein